MSQTDVGPEPPYLPFQHSRMPRLNTPPEWEVWCLLDLDRHLVIDGDNVPLRPSDPVWRSFILGSASIGYLYIPRISIIIEISIITNCKTKTRSNSDGAQQRRDTSGAYFITETCTPSVSRPVLKTGSPCLRRAVAFQPG